MFLLSLIIGCVLGYLLAIWDKQHTQKVQLLIKDVKEQIVKEKTTITSPSKVYYGKNALQGIKDETDTTLY
mgnify:CR=1 FL=1